MTHGQWSLIALASAWLLYFVLHSVLAAMRLKNCLAARFPGLMPCYRLAYNVFASITLLPILWLVLTYPGPMLWAWQGFAAWLANGLALISLLGFLSTLNHYDTQSFLGLSQWRNGKNGRNGTLAANDGDAFHLSPIHRYVRHPWYFFSLVLIWTRDMDMAMLLSAVLMTAYFIVGSRFEDRKLLRHFGETYRCYMLRVPGLLPWPGKSLSARQAAALAEHDTEGLS